MQETENAPTEELEHEVPSVLPVLPLRKIVLFPAMVLPETAEGV